MIQKGEQSIVRDRNLPRAKSTGDVSKTVNSIQSTAKLRESPSPLLIVGGDTHKLPEVTSTAVAIHRKANVSRTATLDRLTKSKTPSPSRNEKSRRWERRENSEHEVELEVPRSKTPTLRGNEKRRVHKVELPEESRLDVEHVDVEHKRPGKVSRTSSLRVKAAGTIKVKTDPSFAPFSAPTSNKSSPIPQREEETLTSKTSSLLQSDGEAEAPTSKASSPTLPGKAETEELTDEEKKTRRRKYMKVSFTGTKTPVPTYREGTPRGGVKVNQASVNLRTGAKEALLGDLGNRKTRLGKEVRAAGVTCGWAEAWGLGDTLRSALKSAQQLFSPEEQTAEESAIKNIVREMFGVNNPLVDAGQSICVEVAEELVKRLAQWTDAHAVMEQSNNIIGQVPLSESSRLFKQWEKKLHLSKSQAKGLYLLAQDVGKIVGNRMKEKEKEKELKLGIKSQRFYPLKRHCKPGSEIVKGIDGLYERIAKKVAIEMAESLVGKMQDLPEALYSAEVKSPDAPSTRRPVFTRRTIPKEPTQPEVKTITSPANPAFSPPGSSDSPATAQSPLDTAVQQETGIIAVESEYHSAEIHISPTNPGADNKDT
jgi:hypothetical protein